MNKEINLQNSIKPLIRTESLNFKYLKRINLNNLYPENDSSFQTEENELGHILDLRDKTFEKEFNELSFTFTTTVEFKYKKKYRLYTLLINNYKIYILDNLKNIPLSDKKQIKLDTDDSMSNRVLNTEIRLKNQTQEKEIKIHNLKNPVLSLNFDLITCKLLINEEKKVLTIITLGKKLNYFYFRFTNQEVFSFYSYHIERIIINSNGYKNNLMGITLQYINFFKKNIISNKEFESKAKTGDLLLFKTDLCSASFQRFFTRDKYDHIALIIKKNKYIQFYDTTKNNKCNLMYWELFKHNSLNLCYKKIVYRRLIIQKDNQCKINEIQNNIEKLILEFINETKKKEYYISYSSLFCCKQLNQYEKMNKLDKNKGFSCSSLIAAAYNKLGILQLDKTIHSYLPGHFSEEKKLNLNKGFYLSNEEIIDFSQ